MNAAIAEKIDLFVRAKAVEVEGLEEVCQIEAKPVSRGEADESVKAVSIALRFAVVEHHTLLHPATQASRAPHPGRSGLLRHTEGLCLTNSSSSVAVASKTMCM